MRVFLLFYTQYFVLKIQFEMAIQKKKKTIYLKSKAYSSKNALIYRLPHTKDDETRNFSRVRQMFMA